MSFLQVSPVMHKQLNLALALLNVVGMPTRYRKVSIVVFPYFLYHQTGIGSVPHIEKSSIECGAQAAREAGLRLRQLSSYCSN